jgi:hypothetical protein
MAFTMPTEPVDTVLVDDDVADFFAKVILALTDLEARVDALENA